MLDHRAQGPASEAGVGKRCLPLFRTVGGIFPEQGDKDGCLGQLPAQPPDGVTDVRLVGALHVAQAHECDACRVERKYAGHRQHVRRLGTNAEPASFQKLRNDERERLVERAEAGNAKDGFLAPPFFPQFHRCRHLVPLLCFLCWGLFFLVAICLGLLHGLVGMRAEVVDDFGHRVADTDGARLVELAPVGVRLGTLEALDQNILVVGDKRLVLEIGLRLLGRFDKSPASMRW